MALLLLLVIYVAFIGLGLPDSLFGTAWPAIYSDLGLPFSFGSFVTLITSCGTVYSSFRSDKLIKRWGTYRVTLFSTALTGIAILGMAWSGNFLFFCLCALPLGLGAGAIDSALNNYVSLHYTAAKMNFLHCFYGLGVTLSPLVLSIVLQGEYGWRGGYNLVFFFQAIITAIILFSYSLWERNRNSETAEEQYNTLSLREVLRLKGIIPMLTLFFSSVALMLLIFSPHIWITTAALMLIGIGNGPMFPSFSFLTPENFGRENSLSAMGIQIAVANISMMLMPVLCGLMTQQFSMNIFPYFLAGCFVLMVIAYRMRPSINLENCD